MSLGKRFIVVIIALLCVSAVTVLMKYDAESYIKLIALAVGIYTISQTVTDIRKNGGKNV